jgi:hypothetical protein
MAASDGVFDEVLPGDLVRLMARLRARHGIAKKIDFTTPTRMCSYILEPGIRRSDLVTAPQVGGQMRISPPESRPEPIETS